MSEIAKLAASNPQAFSLIVVSLVLVAIASPKLLGMLADRLRSRALSAREARDTVFSEAFVRKVEESRKRVHELSSDLGEIELRTARNEKELDDMRRKLERLTDEHTAIKLDMGDLKSDVRHTKELVERLDERIEKMETPINEIAAWVTMRRGRSIPDTPQ